MAETTKKDKVKTDDRVTIRINRMSETEEENKFVGLNGKNYLIPKNKDVEVRAAVKYEVERSDREKAKAISRKQELSGIKQGEMRY